MNSKGISRVLLAMALILTTQLAFEASATERHPQQVEFHRQFNGGDVRSDQPEPCDSLLYSCGPTFYWSIPNDQGSDFFNMRFTPSGCCTLKTVGFTLYDSYAEFSNVSGAGIDVYIWDDDGLGYPGAVQYLVNVPGPSLVFLPDQVTIDVLSAGLAFCDDFHVGFTVVDQALDNIALLSDDGTCGTGRSSFASGTSWQTMAEGYDIDVNFLVSAEICPVGEVCYATGDIDGDTYALTGADYVTLLAYLAGLGPAPIPLYEADLNGDCVVDSLDGALFSDFLPNDTSVFDPYGGYPVRSCCHLEHAGEFYYEQLDFYDQNGVLVVPNSDWGHVSFHAFTQPSFPVQYMNISAKVGNSTGWIVRNFPILPSEYMAPGRYGLDLDLGLLGISSGVDFDSIHYGVQITSTLQTVDPNIPTDIVQPSLAAPIQSFGGDVQSGSTVYSGPGTLSPAYTMIAVDLDSTIKYRGLTDYDSVPSVQEGNDECASGSTARSLRWLSNEYGLGLDLAQKIQQRLDDADLMDQGATLEDMANAKKDYINETNVPLEAHYWYSEDLFGAHPDWHSTPFVPSVSSASIDLLDWLWQEMKRGQDIEIFIRWDNTSTGHYVTLVGMDKINKKLEYRDDENQGDSQAEQSDGDEAVKEADLTSLGSGEYGWKGSTDRIIGAFAESPVSRWYSTGDPGTTRMPHAGTPRPDPMPWSPIRYGGTILGGIPGYTVWIGKDNEFMPDHLKSWTIYLFGTNALRWDVDTAHAYIANDPVIEVPNVAVTSISDSPGPPAKRIIKVTIVPQPDWEVLGLVRGAGAMGFDTLSIFPWSFCTQLLEDGNTANFVDSRLGGPADNMDVREVMLFADSAPVAEGGVQTMESNSEWAVSIVSEDPDGQSRPQGGVHWTLVEGKGLNAGDVFSMTYQMATDVDSIYDFFVFDRKTDSWTSFRLVNTALDYICGDADGSGVVNISDAVYLIAYIFGGGLPPIPSLSGDVDCNGIVNISDAVYLIAYIFGGGPEPCAACP
jgi:hypothetical protein